MRWLALLTASLTVAVLARPAYPAPMPPPRAHLTTEATVFRAATWRTDPCLVPIIDHEDPSWDPTISYGGGHNVNDSYGLGQANPGTKMASFGADWATSRSTQLRWARAYAVARYGSECAAWGYWQAHWRW